MVILHYGHARLRLVSPSIRQKSLKMANQIVFEHLLRGHVQNNEDLVESVYSHTMQGLCHPVIFPLCFSWFKQYHSPVYN